MSLILIFCFSTTNQEESRHHEHCEEDCYFQTNTFEKFEERFTEVGINVYIMGVLWKDENRNKVQNYEKVDGHQRSFDVNFTLVLHEVASQGQTVGSGLEESKNGLRTKVVDLIEHQSSQRVLDDLNCTS